MNPILTRGLAAGALTASLAAQSNAFYLYYTEDRTYVPSLTLGGGHTYLNPENVYKIDSSSTEAIDAENLIEAGWPAWSVSRSSSDAPGEVAVSNYSALQYYDGSGHVTDAGAQLEFDYISSHSSFPYYRFVHVIYASDASGPYLDPTPGNDYYPFYYTEEENLERRSGTHYYFGDEPSRVYDGSQAIGWAGALFLVEWYSAFGQNALVIHDGVYWGWNTIGTGESDLWGGGGGASVPEPGTLVALVALTASAMRMRRPRT